MFTALPFSKDANLMTYLTCCAATPASVPQLQVKVPGAHTLCAHMFQPHISPRRYLQCPLVNNVYTSHTNRPSNISRTHPCCAPCHTRTICSHKWSSHATASSLLQSVVVAETELLSVAPEPVIPVITQVNLSLLRIHHSQDNLTAVGKTLLILM
jgi:hypothetical protein